MNQTTQIASNRWVDFGWSCWQRVIVCMLTLAHHRNNTKVSTVEVLLLALQLRTLGGFLVVGLMLAKHMLIDCNRLNRHQNYLDFQKLNNLSFDEKLSDSVLQE